MNKLIITGRISSDPEVRYTQDQKPVVRFNFAVSRIYKRDGEPDADFFGCVLMGRTAERFEKLNVPKGTKLMLEGEVRNNNYTGKDGVKRYENQVMVNQFEFCESKGQTHNTGMPTQTKKAVSDGFTSIDDEVDDASLPWN